MTDTEIRKQVDTFVALPSEERREKYMSLPRAVRLRARAIIEKNRGIAHRTQEGVPVFTEDEYKRQILTRAQKLADMPQRMKTNKERMVELKKQLQENYGDEALKDVEKGLKAITA